MKKLLLGLAILASVVFASDHAQSQTSIAIDIDKGMFAWQYTQDPAKGVPSEFRMKCGQASGVYNQTHVIADPAARSVDVLTVVKQPGTYFCAVFAANQFGESGPSNEVSFQAGSSPNSADSLVITTKP